MKKKYEVLFYIDKLSTKKDQNDPSKMVFSTKELASHCMEDIDLNFSKKVKKGDIIVANKNFGCGSSREHAPIAIKESGISCVIASTFARIFYRNAINIGLPILECDEAVKNIDANDELEVNFDTGLIKNLTKNEQYQGEAFPEFMQNIINNNGLIGYIRNKGQLGD